MVIATTTRYPEETMSHDELRNAIRNEIEALREKRGITPSQLTTEYKSEPSCEAFGEGHNLVEFQLLRTPYGSGGWRELTCHNVCLIAIMYLRYGFRCYVPQAT